MPHGPGLLRHVELRGAALQRLPEQFLFFFEDALAQHQPALEDFEPEFFLFLGAPGLVQIVAEFLNSGDFIAAAGEQVQEEGG